MFNAIIDNDTFQELYITKSINTKLSLISNYDSACIFKKSSDVVSVGVGTINCIKILYIRLNKQFKMGTIGVAEGEKIALALEYATKKKLPIVAVVASGGIRVQESTLALMQMIKMTSAVKQHSDKGLLFISIVTNPTLGGASASFVSLADIIIAEKGATYGFSGKRIIEDTTNEQLPDDFQTAEYAKRHGMVDIVADKDEIKSLIGKLLRLHKR